MVNKKQNADFIPNRVRERLQANNISMMKMISDLTDEYGTDEIPTYRTFQKCMQHGAMNRVTLDHVAQYLNCNVLYLIDDVFTEPFEYMKGTLFMNDSYSAFRNWLHVAESVVDPVTYVKPGKTVPDGRTALHLSLKHAEESYKELFALMLEMSPDDEDIAIADEYFATGQLDQHLHYTCLYAIEEEIKKIDHDLKYLKNRKNDKDIMEENNNGNEKEQ